MRAQLVRALMKHPGGLPSRIELQILTSATGRAFGKQGIFVLLKKDPLQEYIRYTAELLNGPADRTMLYETAYALGQRIRKWSGLESREERMELVKYLYRNIGIRMEEEFPGTIRVVSCAFSRCYDPEQCWIMSAMDRGMITGICGGESLEFQQRITEGADVCLAKITGGIGK